MSSHVVLTALLVDAVCLIFDSSVSSVPDSPGLKVKFIVAFVLATGFVNNNKTIK